MSIQTLQDDLIGRLRRTGRRAGQGPAWLPRLAELALVALLAWLAVRLVYSFSAGPEPVAGASQTGTTGVTLSPDMSVFGRFDPFVGSGITAPTGDEVLEARATSLDITLNGIWADSDGGGLAIIEAGNNEQRMYQVGERIMQGVTLERLYSDRAIILRGGVRESVFLENRLPSDGAQARQRQQPRTTAASENSIGAAVGDLAQLISVRPIRQNGETIGYEIFPRGNVAQFEALGLREGDRIMAINGQMAPTDSERLMDMIGELRSASTINLTLDRRGSQVDLSLNMDE